MGSKADNKTTKAKKRESEKYTHFHITNLAFVKNGNSKTKRDFARKERKLTALLSCRFSRSPTTRSWPESHASFAEFDDIAILEIDPAVEEEVLVEIRGVHQGLK